MYHPEIKKLFNKNRILECVFHYASIARTGIAEGTDTTPATVALIVNGSIVDDTVWELGEADSGEGSSGRRWTLIDMVLDYAYSIGVEFTQKALVACITDLKEACICQSGRPFDEFLPLRTIEEIIEQIQSLLDSCQPLPERIINIGTAVPGHMDEESRHPISNHTVW